MKARAELCTIHTTRSPRRKKIRRPLGGGAPPPRAAAARRRVSLQSRPALALLASYIIRRATNFPLFVGLTRPFNGGGHTVCQILVTFRNLSETNRNFEIDETSRKFKQQKAARLRDFSEVSRFFLDLLCLSKFRKHTKNCHTIWRPLINRSPRSER